MSLRRLELKVESLEKKMEDMIAVKANLRRIENKLKKLEDKSATAITKEDFERLLKLAQPLTQNVSKELNLKSLETKEKVKTNPKKKKE